MTSQQAPYAELADDLLVQKFGGGVIGTGYGIPRCLNIINSCKRKQVDVFSALQGVTDALMKYTKNRDSAILEKILSIHLYAAEKYMKKDENVEAYRKTLRKWEKTITRSADSDLILSSGELISAELMCNIFLSRDKDTGLITTQMHDFPIIVNDNESNADPIVSRTNIGLLEEELAKHDIVLVQGFTGMTKSGRIRTLGRGGSDTTAITIAASLGRCKAVLYKETKGIRTGDPEVINQNPDKDSTRLISNLSYSEAENLSTLGGKIFHWKATKIAKEYGVIVHLPYIDNPKIFTTIGEVDEKERLVKYVGGTREGMHLSLPFEELGRFVKRLKRYNLLDFCHYKGGLVTSPELVVLKPDTKTEKNRFHEMIGKNVGREYGIVALVGDRMGPAPHVLERGAKAISEQGIVIHGNISATRNSGEGAYMLFLVDPTNFESTCRTLHREFIENDSLWNS
jgi:aspartokinase